MTPNWPDKQPGKLVAWVLWKKGHGPNPKVGRVPGWWFEFLVWTNWRLAGHHPPRPADLPVEIKGWPWPALDGIAKALRPPLPADPPPPAPMPVKLVTVPPVFRRKGVWATWSATNGTPDPPTLAAQAKQAGCEWVVFQWSPENEAGRLREYIDVARTAGLTVGMWEQINDTKRKAMAVEISVRVTCRAQFAIIVVEGDIGPFDPVNFRARMGDNFPLAVCTTFVGMDTAALNAPWVASNYTLMTEAYTNIVPTITPGTLDRSAYWRGWPPWLSIDPAKPAEEGMLHSIPTVGLWGGADFALYRDALKPWGSAFNAWDAEQWTEQNRQEMAAQ